MDRQPLERIPTGPHHRDALIPQADEVFSHEPSVLPRDTRDQGLRHQSSPLLRRYATVISRLRTSRGLGSGTMKSRWKPFCFRLRQTSSAMRHESTSVYAGCSTESFPSFRTWLFI